MPKVNELIESIRQYQRADEAQMIARPAGTPRGFWRSRPESPREPKWKVRDTAYKTKPVRLMTVDAGAANPRDVWVWSTGPKSRVIERIDLTAPDAEARVGRYLFVAE